MENQAGILNSPSLNPPLGLSLIRPIGTGGFLNPDIIVESFGIEEGMRVADFGSGSGYFTILMAKKTGESGLVTAVDILENSLDIVRSKTKSEGLRNIQTIRSNLEVYGSSGIQSDSQDFVLLANVLFQSDEKDGIIKEAHRILKEKGTLVIIDWKKGTGGFGPPDNLRLDSSAMQSLVASNSFDFVGFLDVGAFHYGLKFIKGFSSVG